MGVKENLEQVLENIERAKDRVGRKDHVQLITVTKTIDEDLVRQAIECGATDIGENRAQELVKRIDLLGEKVNYHMIGNLQSNKVKYIINKVKLIHSLDRKSLAKEINKRAKRNDMVQDCLIQMNISGEESKSGIAEEELLPFVEKVLTFPYIHVRGLMTMAPFTDDEDVIRKTFNGLYQCKELVEKQNYRECSMEYLSMGMSQDYEIAIEEGANMVRVGTSIFGKRDYGGKR